MDFGCCRLVCPYYWSYYSRLGEKVISFDRARATTNKEKNFAGTMSSALDDALCKLKATVAASAKSATLKLDRVGRKKRFIELAAPILDVSSKRCRLEPASTHQSAGDATKQEKAEETTSDFRVDVEYYQNLIDQCEKEDQKQREEGAKSLESVRELRRVYLYGLQKISKLQDLREAPDAIMPGNFVVEK